MVSVGLLDHQVNLENRVQLAPKEAMVYLEHLVLKVLREPKDSLDLLDWKDHLEKMDNM